MITIVEKHVILLKFQMFIKANYQIIPKYKDLLKYRFLLHLHCAQFCESGGMQNYCHRPF